MSHAADADSATFESPDRPAPPEQFVSAEGVEVGGGREVASRWMLAPEIAFLNHGSFGALPRDVARAQSHWRQRIEARPIALLGRDCAALLAVARKAVAALINAEPGDIGFTTNATEGVNAYLAGLALGPGDELVATDHVYNAVRQAMQYWAARAGASYREVEIGIPVQGPDEVTRRVLAGVTDRTRLLVVDHVTSPTAIRMPVEAIAAACRDRGVDVLIDGAHAPGMLSVDLKRLATVGVVAYAANLHKWVCAPKGSAFLWVRRDRQATTHPVVISHFLGQGFQAEFGWQGTRDITPWLCAADAIVFLEGLGLARLMDHNHRMARWVGRTLCEAWGVEAISPADGSMLGSMVTVPLPAPLQPGRVEGGRLTDLTSENPARRAALERLQAVLLERDRIEVPFIDFGNRWHVRPCCQVYNRVEQYRHLADAVLRLAESPPSLLNPDASDDRHQ